MLEVDGCLISSHAAEHSSIPAPPANFKLRDDHISGSSLKGAFFLNNKQIVSLSLCFGRFTVFFVDVAMNYLGPRSPFGSSTTQSS